MGEDSLEMSSKSRSEWTMPEDRYFLFGPFRVDPANACVWRGEEQILFPPTTFAVLCYFVEHPSRVITKQALLEAVWPDAYVSEAGLAVRVSEIRKALGDDPKKPQFIETVYRRGYRFIQPVTIAVPPPKSRGSQALQLKSSRPDSRPPVPVVVGREAELAQLEAYLEKALEGQRQFVLISGEAGSGKTALVDLFVRHVRARGQVRIGRGQCVEQYGGGEAYLPLLEALGRLQQEPGGEQLIAILRRYAPTWLVQLPSLVGDTELEALQRKVQGATRERMLREMADAAVALTAEQGLVLVCEDLQWCDHSSLALLAYAAQRRERARLLVIGTYRPAEVAERGHPLRMIIQELQGRGLCEGLHLAPLTVNAVEQYMRERLAGKAFPVELPQLVYRRTNGNALFMVNVIEYCLQQKLIVEKEGKWELQENAAALEAVIPDRLRQMIEAQVEKLNPDEQQVLESASVAGGEFSAAAVAAGVKKDGETVEEGCETLAEQGHFIRAVGLAEWPDGTVSGRYRFRHGLYQNVLYEQVGEARRVQLHTLIGQRKEAAYGESAREIAAELAIHFERGRDYRRAAWYRQQAGENALRCSAPQEAVAHLTKGLELLQTRPDGPESAQQELAVQTALGAALALTQGYGAADVEHAYSRALQLCERLKGAVQLFPVLWGLWVFYNARGALHTARGLAEQLFQAAQGAQSPRLLVQAHYARGVTLFWCGELTPAREQWEQSLRLYDSQPQRPLVSPFLYGEDAPVIARCDVALVLELLGYSDQARTQSRGALAMMREEASPLNEIIALTLLSFVTQIRHDAATTQAQAETVIELATDHSAPFWAAAGAILRGWALTKQGQGEEGIAQMHEGLGVWQGMGAALMRTYWLGLLADAYVHTGRSNEGMHLLEEALADVQTRGERVCAAPLYRLKGELLQQTAGGRHQAEAEAEGCFLQAIEIAHRQEARALELRAATSLARLWQRQGKPHEARNMLSAIYSWFTEGLETAPLQEAQTLLNALA
jgi:DNA-binding winged helix-turn-helix (wHTH) protein/predicted ATPase